MDTGATSTSPIELTRPAFTIARRVASAHRKLIATGTGPAPRRDLPRTLVACSGGADSSALVIALSACGFPISIAHIVHDMRPPAESLADRDVARALAARIGAPFYEMTVSVKGKGNTEAAARRERYRALAALAHEAGCSFVATAHHAGDQLETLVMSLVRGTGPHGLRGVAPRRRLTDGVTLVRPMLDTTRGECLELCAAAGVAYATDATNADPSRFRAALRMGPLTEIEELRPGASRRAGRTALLMRDLAGLLDAAADGVPSTGPGRWARESLRDHPAIVIGTVLRRAFASATSGRGADALRGRMIDDAVRIIRSAQTDPKTLNWPSGVVVTITAREVSVSALRDPGPSGR